MQYLVDSSYAHHHVKRLRSTVKRPRALPFSDEAEVLNELLVVGRQNPEIMENLIALAASKHDHRNDYQRQYMATKRQRDRKVIALEEKMAGKRLSNEQRATALKHQYDVWNRERDRLLQSMTDTSWHDRNARIREFWDAKEAELDALRTYADEHKQPRTKRVIHVPAQPKSELGRKLRKALDSR